MNLQRLKLNPALTLMAIGFVVIASYAPGLSGPFVFDDSYHIVSNPAIALERLDLDSLRNAALYNTNDPSKRPLASISFALNHYFAGGTKNTLSYKVVNLIVHLINTGLIYWLSMLLLGQLGTRTDLYQPQLRYWLPTLIAAIWALHPLQLTSVLYVVQRMTSLSALFVLLGLILFIYGRRRVAENQRHGYLFMTIGLLGGLLLGVASKENATLLPLYILAIEFVFFRSPQGRLATPRGVQRYYLLIILLPYLLVLGWFAFQPSFILKGYAIRDFTLWERLLTEPRILWFYIGLILFPRNHAFGLFHDDIPISLDLLTPWTTLPALCSIILLCTLALVGARRHPIPCFSILWFLIGHSMESSFIGLEIAHEHRNYLPDYGIIFGVAYGLMTITEKSKNIRLGTALIVVYIAILAFSTHSRAYLWVTEDNLIEAMANNHPNSARSRYMLGELYAERKGDPINALRHYKKASELDQNRANALIKIVVVAANTTVKRNVEIPPLPSFIEVDDKGGRVRLKLDKATMAEIDRRLIEKPIMPLTESMLGLLSRCITQEQRNCSHLYDKAIEWYKLTLINPYSNNIVRARLASDLARLHLEYGEYRKALQAVAESRRYDPSQAKYPLLEANIYMHLHEPARAEQIIKKMKRAYAPLPFDILREADLMLAEIHYTKKEIDRQETSTVESR